jgi:hypothetical protein
VALIYGNVLDFAIGKWKAPIRYALTVGMTPAYLRLLWKIQGARFSHAEFNLVDNPLASISARWRILNALRVAQQLQAAANSATPEPFGHRASASAKK